ncbi:MAG: helix-turn-helix transcriptional regulator [Lachnospiraceae bacterium]|nr:helix-turn-helix transcriptional regulator [Lachnospiraceae bacterium]
MINVLERITELRKQKNWTEYQLAERSGLTQSTISSWYRKNILPTLPSLERICEAFGISISQFLDDNNNEISLINPRQKQLLEKASKLDNEQYDALINFLDKL